MILTVLCFPITLAVTAQQIEVPNANFNNFSRTVGVGEIFYTPNSWVSQQSKRLYSRSDTAVEGYGVSVSAGNTVTFTTENYVAISGGKSYSLSFSAKSEGQSGSAILSVYIFDGDYNEMETVAGEEIFLNGEVWADVPCSFTADDNAAFIKIEITIKAGEYKCYFDNLILTETVITPALTTLTGASLRLVKDSPGIRFGGRVEKTVYDQFESKYENVNAGILVTLKESLDSVSEFTAKELSAAGKIYVEIAAEKWNNEQAAAEDGYYGFYCAIVNVKPQNIKRDIAFITYFTYEDSGVTYTVYGNYNQTDNVRSVYSLANEAYLELDRYSEEQQEIITYYATYANS